MWAVGVVDDVPGRSTFDVDAAPWWSSASRIQCLPSEFSPQFLVALDGTNPNQLNYAAQVVAAIARLTSTELKPKVIDLQTAVSATTGALIVANSKAIQQTR